MSVVAVRRRQLPMLTRRLPRVAPCQPAMAAAIVGAVVVGLTPASGGDPLLRLRVTGVAMAAAVAFVLDDRAAATLASSPPTLLERRVVRVGVAVPLIAMWWLGLVALLSARRTEPLPSTSALMLEAATYTAIGFATCVWAQWRSDDRSGGTAASAIVATLFLSGMLPLPSWWPFASSGGAQASTRLQLLLAGAIVAFVAGSRDPATRSVRVVRPGRRAGAGC